MGGELEIVFLEINWKFQGSKTKLFKIKCETKLEFPEGCAYIVCEGSNPKNALWEGYGYFLGQHN